MIRTELSQKLKLAAFDLDGTLLGERGEISAENMAAVRRVQSAGVHVVLASGRHHNNLRKFAEALPGVEWIVSCQGGEAADVQRKVILRREFLPNADVRLGSELGRSLGVTALFYGVDLVCTDSSLNSDIQFYTGLAGVAPVNVSQQQCLNSPAFKVIWVGNPLAIDRALERTAPITSVQMVRTHERIVEMMPSGESKASGLKAVAERLGLKAAETAVFGDGDNDIPMFEWAGVSVAMAHGWPSAVRAATYITGEGPAGTALARGVELLFSKGHFGGNRLERPCASSLTPTT